jgi:hypothetical protein
MCQVLDLFVQKTGSKLAAIWQALIDFSATTGTILLDALEALAKLLLVTALLGMLLV